MLKLDSRVLKLLMVEFSSIMLATTDGYNDKPITGIITKLTLQCYSQHLSC
jgi:hypothetical protein